MNRKKETVRPARKNTAEGEGIARTHGDRVFQVFSYIFTILWVLMALVPMYWLIISSMKDQLDIYKRPVQFYPVIPNNYQYVIEYDTEDKDVIRQDAMVLLWETMDNWQDARAGRITVHAVVDGKQVACGILNKYDFVEKRNYIWSANKLDGALILKYLNKVQEYENADSNFRPVRWQSTPAPKASDYGRTNEVTQAMLSQLTSEGLLKGRVTQCYVTKSVSSLFNNYVAAWEWPMSFVGPMGLGRAFINSVYVALFGIFAQWIIIGLAAYSMAKLMPKKIAGWLTVFYLATLMIPSIVTLIPLYLTVERMGLTNTLWGVILPSIPSAFNLVLFRGFFNNIPQSMFDAARIDGASELRIFTSMVVPLSKSVFGVIALFTFTGLWNDFFWSMLVLKSTTLFTMPLLINKLLNTASTSGRVDIAMSLAMSMIASLPTITVYALFQKQMEKGLVFSGIKE